MRLFTATLAHETSSFSPVPTSMDSFRPLLLHRPSRGEIVAERFIANECALPRKALERGHDVLESVSAATTPSGPMVRADYETLRDEILADLANAGAVDAVALFLHGAQMAEGYDDCEGDLLQRMRAQLGPDVPIGVEIDLHGNVTAAMLKSATFIIACKEYPHTDFPERADELLDLLEATAAGRIHPVTAWRRVPMLGIFHTTRHPMRAYVDGMSAMEQRPGVLTVSTAHGFPWADTPHAAATAAVTTDGDAALADALADELAAAFFAIRAEAAVPLLGVEAALDQAFAPREGLCVVADTADNAGGGAASDATYMLSALLARGARDVALGMVWDPVSVDFAFAAGVGAVLPLRIGGKAGTMSGPPVDAICTVKALSTEAFQFSFGVHEPLGRIAVVETSGIEIVLAARREQVHSPEAFTTAGVDLAAKRVVIVKSAQHFQARFAPIAEEIIYAVAPGATSVDFKSFPYTRLQRPLWPLDEITDFRA